MLPSEQAELDGLRVGPISQLRFQGLSQGRRSLRKCRAGILSSGCTYRGYPANAYVKWLSGGGQTATCGNLASACSKLAQVGESAVL